MITWEALKLGDATSIDRGKGFLQIDPSHGEGKRSVTVSISLKNWDYMDTYGYYIYPWVEITWQLKSPISIGSIYMWQIFHCYVELLPNHKQHS